MGGYGHGFGNMMGGWGGGAMFPFSGIFGLLVLALVIAALVWLVRTILRPQDRATRSPDEQRPASTFSTSAMRAERSTATNICRSEPTCSADAGHDRRPRHRAAGGANAVNTALRRMVA